MIRRRAGGGAAPRCTLSTAAVMLAATLASASHGAKIVAALSAVKADGFLTTCATRLSRGRLMTVVG